MDVVLHQTLLGARGLWQGRETHSPSSLGHWQESALLSQYLPLPRPPPIAIKGTSSLLLLYLKVSPPSFVSKGS